jgi:hypothetical protein
VLSGPKAAPIRLAARDGSTRCRLGTLVNLVRERSAGAHASTSSTIISAPSARRYASADPRVGPGASSARPPSLRARSTMVLRRAGWAVSRAYACRKRRTRRGSLRPPETTLMSCSTTVFR